MTKNVLTRTIMAVLAGGIVLATGACSLFSGPQYRDANGLVTASAAINNTQLQVGDCIVNVSNMTDQVTKIDVVPCDVQHEGEVFAIGQSLSNDDTTLSGYCTDQFEGYVGIPWANTNLKATYFHAASGDTTDVQCVVYNTGVMVTTSYKDSQQ